MNATNSCNEKSCIAFPLSCIRGGASVFQMGAFRTFIHLWCFCGSKFKQWFKRCLPESNPCFLMRHLRVIKEVLAKKKHPKAFIYLLKHSFSGICFCVCVCVCVLVFVLLILLSLHLVLHAVLCRSFKRGAYRGALFCRMHGRNRIHH